MYVLHSTSTLRHLKCITTFSKSDRIQSNCPLRLKESSKSNSIKVLKVDIYNLKVIIDTNQGNSILPIILALSNHVKAKGTL